MVKVVKFGGSSLASAEQFAKVGDIIRADESRKYVVPSAPGKRNSKDTKVTDMLYACYAKAEAGEEFRVPLMKIKERYDSIINGLGLKVTLDEEFKTISKNFKEKAGVDYAASRGEYLNGILMADYLGYEFIDSATVIFFDEEGNLDADKTDKVLAKKLSECEKAVIPGFYGIGADGRVKTFSRGGSDITGSIVAKACHASLYENWTDVSGCLVADPRIIDNPQPIHVITYRELRELSYMGASVLHEDAVFPVRKAGIPINIRNTTDPEAEGTLIVESTCQKPEYTITGIAGKKGFVAVSIDKDMMNSEVGFCRKALQAFEENGISIEHMPSGIDTMTVFVHQEEFEGKEQQVISSIRRLTHPDVIDLEADLGLIAVVGRGMKSTRGTAGRIFSALAHANINVKMIDQGSSELNIIIGVFIAFVFLGKRTRRMGHALESLTFPEFLGKRFDSKFIQSVSGLIIFCAMPIYAAVVLIGAARFLESSLLIDFSIALLILSIIITFYVLFGGIRGVMYTDALQGTIMVVAMVFLLVFVYWLLGGVDTANTALTNMGNLYPADAMATGGTGWTSFPKFGTPFWWSLVSSTLIDKMKTMGIFNDMPETSQLSLF